MGITLENNLRKRVDLLNGENFGEMRHGSLFSGIGGFDLAAEWMGWDNVFHCEIDAKAQKVLKKRFPGSRLIKDVRDIYRFTDEYEDLYGDREVMWCARHNEDFSDCECIGCSEWDDEIGCLDIITAGFPCQPFSNLGKQKGKLDERNMWPETIRVIRRLKPAWFVGENVPGIVSWDNGKFFSELQNQIRDEGYEVWSIVIPASAVGAEHERERIWIVANDKSQRVQGVRAKGKQKSRTLDSPLLPLRDSNGKWKIEPDFRRANDGIPRKMDRLKLIGNAIVPQVAYEIFKAIEKMNVVLSVQECEARDAK